MALTRASSRSPLWVWAKVAVVLVVLDVGLFRWGLLWRIAPVLPQADPTTWGLLYTAAHTLESPAPAVPEAYVVGSSVLFLGVDGRRVERALRAENVSTPLTLLATFGSNAADSALLAWQTVRRRPWLVVYAAASRDFHRDAVVDTPVSRLFDDASVDLPLLAPKDVGGWLDRWVKRGWRLYRYRYFLRRVLLAPIETRLFAPPPTAAAPAAAPAAVPEPPVPPEARTHFTPGRVSGQAYAAWEHWRVTRRFEDYAAWMRENRTGALSQYATETLALFGPDGNPQAASLDWMVRRLREHGVRVVIAFFPENPAFRTPGGEPYFDPALSRANAELFAREAATHGARFVDLRDALDAEDFYDLIHPNLTGMVKLSDRMAGIVAEEWRAAHAGGQGP